MKFKDILKKTLIQEATEKMPDPCNKLGEGKTFCKSLQKILSTGTGGKGAKTLQELSFKLFRKLRNGDFVSMGEKVVLEPGNKFYEDRIKDMYDLVAILQKTNSCSAIRTAVEQDIEKVGNKKMTMRIDDQQKYSLFNRINTHSTNQSYILTKLAQELNKEKDFLFSKIDTYSSDQIIDEMLEALNDRDILNRLDSIVDMLVQDKDSQQSMMDAFNFSRNKGYEVEDQAWNALKKSGYDVYPFSDDFGFIDYFGIDMIAVDERGAHPVQVSSKIKHYPKIFNWTASDCQPFALFKSGDKFVKYSPMA